MAQTSNKGGSNKLRRAELERQRLINCDYCPPHRGENLERVPRERWPINGSFDVVPRRERRQKRGGVREFYD